MIRVVLMTALAPILWGTTYFTSTAFLYSDHPFLTGTLRALPAGLILMLIGRRLPQGSWWWKTVVLGFFNIGAFFAFLFIAADRLPGGVAAVIGGIQPLLVALLASRFLNEHVSRTILLSGVVGALGIALLVLRAEATLDVLGIVAALLGAASMAIGIVLTKKWASNEPALVTTSWQLITGGIILALVTVIMEPLPQHPPTSLTVAGYAYLTVIGTALAYVLWFSGLKVLPARIPAFLGLLSPIVALAIGVLAAGELMTWLQIGGVVLVLASVTAVMTDSRRLK